MNLFIFYVFRRIPVVNTSRGRIPSRIGSSDYAGERERARRRDASLIQGGEVDRERESVSGRRGKTMVIVSKRLQPNYVNTGKGRDGRRGRGKVVSSTASGVTMP